MRSFSLVPRRIISRQQDSRGFSLLLAIIISGVGLSIGLTMLSITVKQLELNSTARDSEIAFRVASAGMECLAMARYDLDHNYATDDSATLPTYNCLGNSIQFNEPITDDSDQVREYYGPADMNWNGRCVDMELRVFGSGQIIDTGGRLADRSCPEGASCYVGIVRGYNRSCEDVGTDSVMAVERELTVEF